MATHARPRRSLRSRLPHRRTGPRRVPVLNQLSAIECGPTCVAMVASAWGRATGVRECRERVGLGRDGADGLQLTRLGRELGLTVTPVSLDLDQLADLRLPAVLHWRFLHYVVLERWDGKRATVVDPAVGRRVFTRAEVDESFTGVALQMTPGPGFQRRKEHRARHAVDIGRRLLPAARSLLVPVLAASLLLQLLVLIPAVATKFVIDTVVGNGQDQLLPALGIGLGLVLVTHGLLTYARSSLLNHLQARVDAQMMRTFFAHLLDLPYRYFQARTSGDLTMRLTSNSMIREILTGQVLAVLVDGLFVLVYVALLVTIQPLYGLVVLVLGGLQFLVVVLTFRSMRELTQRDVTAQVEAQSYAIEVLGGAETVKSSGAEQPVYDRWSELFDGQLAASVRRRRLDSVNEALMGLLRIGAPLALLWVGAWQVTAGALTLGSMLALSALATALLTPLSSLATSTRQLQTVGTHLDRIRDVLEEDVEQDRAALPAGATPTLGGRVELSGVGFRYARSSTQWALRDVNLDVPAGAKVALVGRTGSGKSTLAKMLLGLYPPTEGEVRMDGRPLSGLDIRAVRQQCGVVIQDPSFFAGTIRDNLAFGRRDVPIEQLVEAATLARVHDDIVAMPMAYETMLPEGGGSLSGGQQQRLALARALVGRPAVLVLDEATSHLDAVTERQVDDSLSTLDCTRVVVAHRLSTVRNADLVVVLDDGRVVESGTHRELVARDGVYADLVRHQLERDDTAPEYAGPRPVRIAG